MKLKSLILLAALGFGLTACNKDDATGMSGDDSQKSVAVNLSNLKFDTKAPGTAITNGSTVTLKNIYILFTDANGNIYKGTNTTGSHYFTQIPTTEEAIYHLLPAGVEKVIVVSNIAEATKTALESASKFADVKDLFTLPIAGQQDATNLLLYGEAGLTPATDPATDVHGDLYEAAVEIAPLVARVEIHGFECIDIASASTSYKLNKIGLNDYCPSYTMDDKGEFVAAANQNTVITAENFLGYINGLNGWMVDPLTDVVLTQANSKKSFVDLTAEPAVNAPFVYHVFGSETMVPQILIDVLKDGNTPLYLGTNGFKDVTGFAAGNIYVVNFTFSEEDFDNPGKCVSVTVTSKPWTVVTVTPEF